MLASQTSLMGIYTHTRTHVGWDTCRASLCVSLSILQQAAFCCYLVIGPWRCCGHHFGATRRIEAYMALLAELDRIGLDWLGKESVGTVWIFFCFVIWIRVGTGFGFGLGRKG